MNRLTPALLLVLASVAAAAFWRSLWRRGALDGLAAWWRGASRPARAVALAIFLSAVACGSDKTLGGQFGQGLRMLPRLWPNFAKPDNYYYPMLLDPDTQFCSPGYLFMTNP